MNVSESAKVEQHILGVVTMALLPFSEPGNAAPTLEGLATRQDEIAHDLAELANVAVRSIEQGSDRPAPVLARLALETSRRVHEGLCPPRNRRHRSCQRDVAAAEHIVESLGLSLFDLQFHGHPGELIAAAARASDLTEAQRVDGLAAKMAELLHVHPRSREALTVLDTSPIFQLNSAYRDVGQILYDRNRTTNQSLASVARDHGYRPDTTSDYASPGRSVTGQEWFVRTGLLRSAGVCFLMNGAGTGTGRAIELAAFALTPTLLLRRVTPQDPPPPNEDRFSGEVTGLVEIWFEDDDEAGELLREFLSAEAESLFARHREIISLESGATPEEAVAMASADESAFHGGRISIEEARFWIEKLHFPFAGAHRVKAIRRALGLPAGRSEVRLAPTSAGAGTPADDRSLRSFLAYVTISNLGADRAMKVWNSQYSFGPSDVRRDPPRSVEDWAEIDRRTSR